jgi:hypothetical protein
MSYHIMDKSSTQTSAPPAYENENMRFDRDFGFYKAGRMDMVTSLSKSSPHLFYLSVQPRRSEPTVILRSGPSPTSEPIATANITSFGSLIDVTVGSMNIPVKKVSAFSSAFSFVFPVAGKPETFEWRRSTGSEVKALKGSSNGLKLVHVVSDTVVATWTRPHAGLSKKGKMRFTAKDRESMGDDFEAVVVVTLGAFMERRRRESDKSSSSNTSAVFAMTSFANP